MFTTILLVSKVIEKLSSATGPQRVWRKVKQVNKIKIILQIVRKDRFM